MKSASLGDLDCLVRRQPSLSFEAPDALAVPATAVSSTPCGCVSSVRGACRGLGMITFVRRWSGREDYGVHPCDVTQPLAGR